MPKLPKKLTRFTIQELSAVSSPAQEPALMTIMKSADAPERLAKARADFSGIVATIAERDRVPQHMAMAKARNERPNAFEAAYGTSGDAADNAAEDLGEERAAAASARSALSRMARDIAKTEGVPQHIAMQKARQKRPDLFESL
jgi:hypothetical protein